MKPVTRRQFVKTTAAVASPVILGGSSWAGANDTIQAACVGLHGQGMFHLESLQRLSGVRVRAVCDVDEQVLAKVADQCTRAEYPQPKTYTDLRKLLEDPDLDAVFLAVPNHWHALATVWACQAGKHVYVEKPASHDFWEGRKMVEAARKYQRVVQTGLQLRSSIAAQAAARFLQSGQLGEVYMARGLCFKWRDTIGRAPDEPVPAGVHYNLWMGPAPERPFSKNRFHYNWHWQWAYGNGDIGNQGVHQLDVARWGLGLSGHPDRVCSAGAHVMFEDDQETPNILNTSFEFASPSRGGKKIIQFEVRHWMTNHEAEIDEGEQNTIGVVFYGSEGYLALDSQGNWHTRLGQKREPGPQASAGGNHFRNFLDAVRAHDPALLNCDIEEGHRSAALAHLANISYRLGRSLEFDPAAEVFRSDSEADALLRRQYRKPFEIPEAV